MLSEGAEENSKPKFQIPNKILNSKLNGRISLKSAGNQARDLGNCFLGIYLEFGFCDLTFGIWDLAFDISIHPPSPPPSYFLYPFRIDLGISNSQGTFVWHKPHPVIVTLYSALLTGPMVR
jgi:hypothetical protein